jgi:hypothetical protein
MNLFTNNMLTIQYMTWMREFNWFKYIIVTDAVAYLPPIYIIAGKAIDKKFLGCSEHQLSQGPPFIGN